MQQAVLLGRVSRGERQQDPENQLGPLRAAAARRGVVVAREVAFKLSAWDDGEARRVWQAVIAALDETRADVLMVWAMDRMTRGGIEDTFRKVRELDHRGVGLYSLQEPVLSTADPQTRELILALLAWAAKWESERKSERLRAKLATKKREAAKLGQRPRWGMGISPLDSDVQEMLRLRREGWTYRRGRYPRLRKTGLTLQAIADRTGFGRGTVERALKPFPNRGRPAAAGKAGAGGSRPAVGGGKEGER